MAVEIGTLRALLSLDSSAFQRGVARAEAGMSSMQRRFARVGRDMQRIGRSMSLRVTAPIVAGVGVMATAAMRNATEIQRLAQVANAGTTEFQRFAAGAAEAGLETDQVADILKDMNDRVGDFIQTGGGPMADFFENIAPQVGVTAEQFERLSGPEALQLFVSSLEAANLSQQDMTFYMEAIASDATLLLPLLRNNGEEMRRLGDRAEQLGAIMSEETIVSLNEARQSLRDIRSAGEGFSNTIMASLAPMLDSLATAAANAAEWFSELSPETQRFIGIAVGIAAAIGPLAIALGFVATGLAAMASPIGLGIFAFGALAGVAAAVAMNWDKLVERYPALERIGDIGARLQETWSDLPALKWALLIPALRWARFIPGLRWAALIPTLAWAALRVIPVIGWASLAGSLAWSTLVERIEWTGWIPSIVWRDWVAALNWDDWIPNVDWARYLIPGRAAQQDFAADQVGQALGGDLMNGVTLGIVNGQDAAGQAAADAVEYLEERGREVSQTESPSRVWMALGRDLMDGLGVGIADNAMTAAQAAADAAGQVTSSMTDGVANAALQATESVSTFAGQFASFVSPVIRGTQSISDAFRSMATRVANSFLDSGINGLANVLFGGGGNSGGGFLSAIGGLLSFDGGGFTGAGARVGGIDGRGGFPAILHPNETVIDHTRGSRGAMSEVMVRLAVPEGVTVEETQQIAGNVAVRVVQENNSRVAQRQRRP